MNRYRFICIVICMIVGSSSNAQDLLTYYKSLWVSSDVSIPLIEKEVDSIISIYEASDNDLGSISIANKFYRKLYKRGLYKKAIKYGRLEIELYRKLGLQNVEYTKALYNVGLFYFKLRDFENSFRYYNEIVNNDIDPYITAKSFCELGNYYYRKGDFFRANDYYNQGISRLEKFDNKKLLIKKYIDYSHVLFEIDTEHSLDVMLNILNKGNQLFSEVPNYSLNDYSSLNNNYANYYKNEKRKDFKKASYYYYQNLKKAKNRHDSVIMHASYTNLGALYIESGDVKQKDSAAFFLNEGLKYSVRNDQKSIVYHQLSNYYLDKMEYQKALSNIQKALDASIGLGLSINKGPTSSSLITASKKNNILGALIQKATILIHLYSDSKNITFLTYAIDNLLYADQLVDILLDVSKEEGSKLYWREEASEIYLKGIFVCDILDDKEKAFYFSEKKKALLLTQEVLENTKKKSLPKFVLDKEIKLKKNILDIETKIKIEQSTAILTQLEQTRFELKREYQSYIDSLEELFPAYYKGKQVTRIVSLLDIQQSLDSDQVIISYVSNKDEDVKEDSFNLLYAVIVSNKEIEIIRIGTLDTIEKLVKSYRDQLSKPFETVEDKSNYQNVAYDLFSLLIPKTEISMFLEKKHLIIIPDGTLQYIPFESLVVDKISNRYLLEEHEVSYAYAMSFLQHNTAIERNPTKDIVAFSPVSFDHSDLEDIKNSSTEINGIGEHLSVTVYKEKEASKLNFLSNSSDYKIIHLATHANFSDNLQVAFYDTNLEYNELYTSQNQAELVVLSACNTSLGEMAKGEGVMSLARGFFYAGANTVISSLWNANDKSTAQIMKDFYTNISTGQSKSKALYNAKIKYLESASLSDASPHYWATFILVGDSETMLFSSHNLYYWIILSFILVLIISLLFYFFKKGKFIG